MAPEQIRGAARWTRAPTSTRSAACSTRRSRARVAVPARQRPRRRCARTSRTRRPSLLAPAPGRCRAALGDVVARARWPRTPADRYASAGELARAGGRRARARRTTPRARARRRQRRCASSSPTTPSCCARASSRLLEAAGFDVVGAGGRRRRAAAQGARAPARRGGHRHPHAADPHRRGAARGACDPRASFPASACSCSRSTSRPLRARAARRTSAEGVGYLLKDRVADVDEFADAVRRVAGGGSVLDPEVVRGCSGAAGTRTRSTSSPRASARCSG